MKTLVSCVRDFKKLCPECVKKLEDHNWTITDNTTEYPYNFDFYRKELSNASVVVAGIEKWGAREFDFAPNLCTIIRFGTGVDNIDLDEAEKRGIKVRRIIDGNSNAVAEQTIALIYALLKRIPELDRKTKKGEWYRPMCNELSGKQLGFIGFGRIAQSIAFKLSRSDLHMVAYDIDPKIEIANKLNVTFQTFEDILEQSDILTLHLPLTEKTNGLFGNEVLKRMKPNALVINTSRAQVIDQQALIDNILNGHLGGAAIDVFEEQPVGPINQFSQIDNIICSPYISSRTNESMIRSGNAIIEYVLGEHG